MVPTTMELTFWKEAENKHKKDNEHFVEGSERQEEREQTREKESGFLLNLTSLSLMNLPLSIQSPLRKEGSHSPAQDP